MSTSIDKLPLNVNFPEMLRDARKVLKRSAITVNLWPCYISFFVVSITETLLRQVDKMEHWQYGKFIKMAIWQKGKLKKCKLMKWLILIIDQMEGRSLMKWKAKY
jgi:hypothetical protein